VTAPDARSLWGKGDYGAVARRMQPAADALVRAAGVAPRDRVLDVAAGTGNVAVAAARRGAHVLAIDLSPELVARGADRCHTFGLHVEWREGDAHALPVVSESLDIALSAFGVMYASDPHGAVDELFRAVHRDGVVGLASWTRGSFQDAAHRALARHVPAPEPPRRGVDWLDPDAVRALLAPHACTVEVVGGEMSWCFDSVGAWLEQAARAAPPLVAVREAVAPDTFAAAMRDIEAAVEPFVTRVEGAVLLRQDFSVVVARKR
jgi:SAM-dependent methyltransferase